MKANSRFLYLLFLVIVILGLSFFFLLNNNSFKYEIVNKSSKNLEISPEQINKYRIKTSLDNIILKDLKKSLDPQDFNDIRNKEELHTYLWRSIFGEYEKDPKAYRDNLIEKSKFLSERNIKNMKWNEKILATIHHTLYPWLYGFRYQNIKDIIESSHGKGIVISVGNYQFKYALSTIDALRNIIKCDLPIEVFYNGNDDLSKENRDILLTYDDIYISDLKKYFDNEILKNSGWDSKPFCILASRFEEIILMDADVTYLRDPAELFDEEGYQRTGTLYFMDRTLSPEPNTGTEWIHSWMINPLPETLNLRFLNGTSTSEMESSTVLMNKTQALLGLLATCKLNEQKVRDDVVYNMFLGDKETFWIGFDMARQSYYMEPTPCVFLGKVDENNQICGHIGHAIHDKLYYWNGHIVVDKYAEQLEYVDYEIYSYDYIGSEWNADLSCMIVVDDKNPPHKISNNEMNVYRRILSREKFKHFIIPEDQ